MALSNAQSGPIACANTPISDHSNVIRAAAPLLTNPVYASHSGGSIRAAAFLSQQVAMYIQSLLGQDDGEAKASMGVIEGGREGHMQIAGALLLHQAKIVYAGVNPQEFLPTPFSPTSHTHATAILCTAIRIRAYLSTGEQAEHEGFRKS